jgi:hypothetical protein
MSEYLDRASELRSATTKKIEAIQADGDLSEVAKGKRIAVIREEANLKLEKTGEAHAKDTSDTHARLQKRVFGLGFKQDASAVEKNVAQQNFRDAIDRASKAADPQAALSMLKRARITGDSMLAKAAALVAYERDWAGVLNEFAGSSVDAAAGLEELGNFEAQMGNRAMRRISEGFAFSPIPETSEERSAAIAASPAILGAAPGTRDAQPRG